MTDDEMAEEMRQQELNRLNDNHPRTPEEMVQYLNGFGLVNRKLHFTDDDEVEPRWEVTRVVLLWAADIWNGAHGDMWGEIEYDSDEREFVAVEDDDS